MDDFAFAPCDLESVAGLSGETKAAIAAYEQCIQGGDADAVGALRRTIEDRIEDLENYYISHVDDERSVLFEKQRLKLRKLLHEYDTLPVRGPGERRGSGGPGHPTIETGNYGGGEGEPVEGRGSGGGDDGMVVTTRVIREDTRLQLVELQAWFQQAGHEEMSDATPEVVEAVFHTVTRTNVDGKMSIRDLRQWYLTFGRRALAMGLAPGSEGGLVSAALVTKATRQHGSKKAPAGPKGPLYQWEAGGSGGAKGGSPSAMGKTSGATWGAATSAQLAPAEEAVFPGGLPNGMLELQIRLTPEEYAQVQLRRRMLEAEESYKARIVAAKERVAQRKGEVAAVDKARDSSAIREGPYEEPAARDSFFFRSP